MAYQLLMLLQIFQRHHLHMNIGGAATVAQHATLAKNDSCLYQHKILIEIEKGSATEKIMRNFSLFI